MWGAIAIGVAGQEVLAVADADDQRAAEPGADDLAGAPGADDGQAVRPLEPGQDPLDGGEQLVAVAPAPGRSGGR